MNEWISTTLGDLLGPKGYIRGPFGSSLKRGEMKSNGTPVYEQQHAIYNTREFRFFIDNEKLNELSRFKVKSNDLIISCSGTVGKISIIGDSDPKGIISQALLILRPESNNIRPFFLKYFLTSELGQYHLLSASHGSVQPNIAERKIVQQIPITLPNVEEQDKIIEVLSSLDDKIDLLHRNNKTLEQLAETIFRQWYNTEGSENWDESTLYQNINLVGGGTPNTKNVSYWEGDVPWLSGGDISGSHKNYVIDSDKTISELGLQNSSACLLPKHSTVISARGTVGKYCLLSKPMAFSQSNYGVLPKFTDCYFFTYLLVNYFVEELRSASYGTVFDTITTDTFRSLLVRLPSEELIRRLDVEVAPYFEKMLNNSLQIQSLQGLRDTLLPKLMDGTVRIVN